MIAIGAKGDSLYVIEVQPTRQLAIRAREFQADAEYPPLQQIAKHIIRPQVGLGAVLDMQPFEGIEPVASCRWVQVANGLDSTGTCKGLVHSVLAQEIAN